jgi:hypothetical protein
MGKVLKASVDFQLFDNGQATVTLTPIDAVGNPTKLPDGTPPPTWTSSDPAVVVSSVSADGLSAILNPSGTLATGVVITATTTLPNGTAISGSGDPIDVVASGPTGFSIAEQ